MWKSYIDVEELAVKNPPLPSIEPTGVGVLLAEDTRSVKSLLELAVTVGARRGADLLFSITASTERTDRICGAVIWEFLYSG
ncbi:hypothetical protein E2542_SST23376 [Spatholobus suberectus]|nr:hypothetical protein E2542_SST23376 [Spatholobus suberectus]